MGRKETRMKALVLETDQDGYVAVDKTVEDFVGRIGVAHTDLRPSGKIMIGDMQLDAMSDGGFIQKGSEVVVVRVSSGQVICRKK